MRVVLLNKNVSVQGHLQTLLHTEYSKILKILTPEKNAVIILKLEQSRFTSE